LTERIVPYEMPADTKTPEPFSLKRWSRRKLEAAHESVPLQPESMSAALQVPDGSAPVAAIPVPPEAPAELELPPVESLTIDSDFTAFLQPKVDESLKRQALKKLFADPRFNVMDGLDVYIDDYTKSDPIPSDILERLMKAQFSWSPQAASESPEASAADSSTGKIDAPSASATEPASSPVPDAGQDISPVPDPQDPRAPSQSR
jgi:hypothetical protein